MNLGRSILVGVIRLYQVGISPLLHAALGPAGGCRFRPTCSAYAAEAIQRHGVVRGGWLAVTRVCRCHPWGPAGDDPVPPAVRPVSKPSLPPEVLFGVSPAAPPEPPALVAGPAVAR